MLLVIGFKYRWRHSSYLPKLGTEVLGAAVSHLPGDLTEGLFSISQQFFYFFDALGDDVFFERYANNCRKEFAQV